MSSFDQHRLRMLSVPAEPECPMCRHSRQTKGGVERCAKLVLAGDPRATRGINDAAVELGPAEAMRSRLIHAVRAGFRCDDNEMLAGGVHVIHAVATQEISRDSQWFWCSCRRSESQHQYLRLVRQTRVGSRYPEHESVSGEILAVRGPFRIVALETRVEREGGRVRMRTPPLRPRGRDDGHGG